MIIDPALFRNISLQTNDQGTADALLALTARRMIDKDGGIQIDPDDLPATMRRLGDVGGVPLWLKFRIKAAQISSGTVDAGGNLRIPLFTAPALTVISGAVIAPVGVFVQDPDADPQLTGFDTLAVGAAYDDGAGGIVSVLSAVGFSDGPEITTDPTYIVEDHTFRLLKGARAVFASLSIPSQIDPDPPILADYEKIISGAFDLWLLVAKLPA